MGRTQVSSAVFSLEEEASKERDEVELPGYEQANHLKGQGKDKLLGAIVVIDVAISTTRLEIERLGGKRQYSTVIISIIINHNSICSCGFLTVWAAKSLRFSGFRSFPVFQDQGLRRASWMKPPAAGCKH